MQTLVLFGAGTTGRVIARNLQREGKSILVFADNNPAKWGKDMEGIPVVGPEEARQKFPEAKWICSALKPELREEIKSDIQKLGVNTLPLWEFMPRRTGLPSINTWNEVVRLVADDKSRLYLWDQYEYRTHGEKHIQCNPLPSNEIYFPDFIAKREDDHFVDCGAADGDTIAEFKKRWKNFKQITAFEPDESNLKKLLESTWQDDRILRFNFAISDHFHESSFTSTGDYSAHLGGSGKTVQCTSLDDIWKNSDNYPTFIKMDIEGSELDAIWGAREIIRKHSPVLAICAYHTAEHLWEIPLLIHALNPDCRLYLHRYAEGTWETVWYAVPEKRMK